MAYVIDEVVKSKNGVKNNPVVDYSTANQQAQERARQRQNEINAARNNNTDKGTTTGSTPTTPTQPVNEEPAFDWAAYYAELQRQAQERANAAYERNMSRIASAYDSAAGSLGDNYNSTVSRLNAARDKSMNDVNTDAEKSLREAYINNMLTKKNLNQRLSAMGYNGGATETTMAQLANNYGNSRTGINETLNNNISNLDMTYNDNLAAALQSYNSAKANLDLQRMQLEMQAENARNNAEASSMSANFGIDSGYATALQNALAKQAAYEYDPTMATNDFIAGNAQQAQSISDSNNYAMWMALQLLGGGNSANDVSKYLQYKGYDGDTITDILRKLGAA